MASAMMLLRRSSLAVFVLLGFSLNLSESLRFDLVSGRVKCMTEDIKRNSMSAGKYNVISPNEGTPLPDTHKVTVRVTSSRGNDYHRADDAESGQFGFTAPESGEYMACFLVPDHNPALTVTVDFDWRTGIPAKDWGKILKQGHIAGMEFDLKRLMATVDSIHDEMFYLQEREEEMQALNRSTNSQMFWLGFLSLLICLSVAGVQVWYLKSYFERKKLL